MNETNNIETVRHSLSHILAAAVGSLYPDAKLGIGPAIENGFYYDFDLGEAAFKPEDAKQIQKKMVKMIASDYHFVKRSLPKAEALAYLKEKKQPYKIELAEAIEDKEIGFYDLVETKSGKVVFTDMCAGPHITSTTDLGEIGFGFNRIAGAYWKGDEKNKMLQRIYFYAFPTIKEMDDYRQFLLEAEKRDHKKLGQTQDLFSFHPEAPGMPFWHQKGMVIWNTLEKLGKELRQKYGFIEIKTPLLAKNSLWITSGHWDHYKDGMFTLEIDNETYGLKPMDCPFNIKIYQTRQRSYRDLPIRYTEIGINHRKERSGELNGLLRVQQITQDDSHLFVREDQIKAEITNLLDMIEEYYKKLNLTPEYFLSTRPDDAMGEKATWDKAEQDLKEALEQKGIKYSLKDKDGAFYGPKIDVDIKDALGRSWQVATVQLDFQLPGRFGCEYIDENSKAQTPVMIHAAVFGSFERMIGILIEHFGGALPVWLAPIQVRILPISAEKHLNFCQKAALELEKAGIRVEVDERNESIGKKIREAEIQKIPFMLIAGEMEIEQNKLAVRRYGVGDEGASGVPEIIKKVLA